MTKKIIFMGSRPVGYSCLKYLLENETALDVKVVGVLTEDNKEFNKKLSLIELAKKNNIRIVADLEKYLTIKDFDILISVQYHRILKKRHIDKAKQIAVNLHMAPLPEYRGCNQFSFAILNNDREFGTTIHQLGEGIDSGPILFEKRFPIPKNCFVKNLYDLTSRQSLRLFKERIKDIIDGRYIPKDQCNFLSERKCSLHYRKEIDGIKKIDPNWPEEKIFRHFRATYMPGFEPPYMLINNTKVYLTLAKEAI